MSLTCLERRTKTFSGCFFASFATSFSKFRLALLRRVSNWFIAQLLGDYCSFFISCLCTDPTVKRCRTFAFPHRVCPLACLGTYLSLSCMNLVLKFHPSALDTFICYWVNVIFTPIWLHQIVTQCCIIYKLKSPIKHMWEYFCPHRWYNSWLRFRLFSTDVGEGVRLW